MSRRRSTELNEVLLPNLGENVLDSLEKALPCGIVMRRYPLSLQYSPYGLRYVELRGIRWKVEYEESPFVPFPKAFLHLFAFVYGGVVNHQHRGLGQGHGKPVHEFDELIRINGFCCSKTVVVAVTVNHTENVEPALFLRGYDTLLIRENPPVGHISFGADMALISEKKVNISGLPQFFKLLQQLLTVLVVLRRGFPLWRFPYTSKSCANTDKKFLSVPLQSFLPVDFSTSAQAFSTLCRCFLIASLTAASSVFCRMRFLPRPGLVFRPSSPFSRNCLTQCMTLWCVWPARAPAAALLRPSALDRTMRHLIRKQWVFPSRYPFVRDSLWESDISIFAACLDIVIILCKTQQTNSMPHYVN